MGNCWQIPYTYVLTYLTRSCLIRSMHSANRTEPMTTPFVVVMRNAVGPEGRKGDAYIGQDLRFSTFNLGDARGFSEFDAERFADHWRGYYRGFHGGCVIDVLDRSAYLSQMVSRGYEVA